MNRKLVAVFIIFFFAFTAKAQVSLKRNQVIKKNTKVKTAVYAIDAYDDLNKSAIIIEGNNIVVDFNKAVLKGSNGKEKPDQFFGTAIIVRKGKNITIKNLTAKGYKIAVRAEGIEGLKIENCDFSYNYRGRLDDFEEQLLPNWGFYEVNENNEWVQYGAAFYLAKCNKAVVKNCKVTGSQNALLLTKCNGGRFYNNDFSFNSGFGVGMYKCSSNELLYNKLNFNVRTYGFIKKTAWQYSAGIRLAGECNYNTFYKNSVTHGGDGFNYEANLTPSNSISPLPEGNRIWGNDFSYAADCGIETAFTSMHVYDNRVYECSKGYSGKQIYFSTIANNKFRNNNIAIEIINGSHDQIVGNIFFRDSEAVRLWTTPKFNDQFINVENAKSIDYTIHLNSFNQNPTAYNFYMIDSIKIYNNRYSFVDLLFRLDSTVTNIDSTAFEPVDTTAVFPEVSDPIDPFKGNGKLAGRDKIMITEWGPYDFGYPIIWNSNAADTTGLMEFDILGPKGKWKLVSSNGIEFKKNLPDSLPAKISGMITGNWSDVEVVLEYNGPAFTDQFGNKIPANKPYQFVYKRLH